MMDIKSKIDDLIHDLEDAKVEGFCYDDLYKYNTLSDYIYYLNLLTHKVIIYDRDEDKFFKNPLESAKQVSEPSKAEPVYLPLDKLEMFNAYTCFRIIAVGD